MNITLLGNCQTKALAWYIQQINSQLDVKWICIEPFKRNDWANQSVFRGKPIDVITCVRESITRLNVSDVVIFQHIAPTTSANFHYNQLKKHAAKATLLSTSSFLFDPQEPSYLQGMIQRAVDGDIDISAPDLIERHGSKIIAISYNHPNVFYFMEVVREICSRVGCNFYCDEQYQMFIDEGYPFG